MADRGGNWAAVNCHEKDCSINNFKCNMTFTGGGGGRLGCCLASLTRQTVCVFYPDRDVPDHVGQIQEHVLKISNSNTTIRRENLTLPWRMPGSQYVWMGWCVCVNVWESCSPRFRLHYRWAATRVRSRRCCGGYKWHSCSCRAVELRIV